MYFQWVGTEFVVVCKMVDMICCIQEQNKLFIQLLPVVRTVSRPTLYSRFQWYHSCELTRVRIRAPGNTNTGRWIALSYLLPPPYTNVPHYGRPYTTSRLEGRVPNKQCQYYIPNHKSYPSISYIMYYFQRRHDQTTLFVDYSTNTTNNLFVDPQKNLFVAICGLL